MINSLYHNTLARWFFLAMALATGYLYWHVLQPFVIVLVTAAIVAVVVTPLEKKILSVVKWPKLSVLLTMLFVIIAVVVPLAILSLVMAEQALALVNTTVGNAAWRESFNFNDLAIYRWLPEVVQRQVASYDPSQLFASISAWVYANLGTIFSKSVEVIFKTSIFFICLFFFLLDREKIYREILALSPFRDAVDRNIVGRMIETVRGVVFGALIVSLVQGVVAAIGMTIFGVPGALVWAALVVIAAQVPILGTGAVMVPVVLYMALSGQEAAAIGLAIWSLVAVGSIDNILSPYIVGKRTRMHVLLILLSILGGLEYFGPIGFILGPTILAAFLVVLELYKAGILEKDGTA